MAKMTLFDIGAVEELTSDGSFMALKHINTYMESGWVVIATCRVGLDEGGESLRYSLDWSREKGRPVHPRVKTSSELMEKRQAKRDAEAETSL